MLPMYYINIQQVTFEIKRYLQSEEGLKEHARKFELLELGTFNNETGKHSMLLEHEVKFNLNKIANQIKKEAKAEKLNSKKPKEKATK